jgi:hypothetical protein
MACGIGGLAIMIPPGSGGGTEQDLKLTPLVSQPLKPSSEAQTVSYQDKVRVTVPGGLLKSEETLTISAVGNPPPMKIPAFEVGTIYDIALGNQHEFDQPITIELAYDAKRLSPDMTAAHQVWLAHWAPETQMWTLLPTEVDAKRDVAIARTSRLTFVAPKLIRPGFTPFEPNKPGMPSSMSSSSTIGGLMSRWNSQSIGRGLLTIRKKW